MSTLLKMNAKELMREAQKHNIPGRSKMRKDDLLIALGALGVHPVDPAMVIILEHMANPAKENKAKNSIFAGLNLSEPVAVDLAPCTSRNRLSGRNRNQGRRNRIATRMRAASL